MLRKIHNAPVDKRMKVAELDETAYISTDRVYHSLTQDYFRPFQKC